MSTNFYLFYGEPLHRVVKLSNGTEFIITPDYLNPTIHVGKRIARDSSNWFLWCQKQEEIITLCEANLNTTVIIDEYDKTYTGSEFLNNILANCNAYHTDSIGSYFA